MHASASHIQRLAIMLLGWCVACTGPSPPPHEVNTIGKRVVNEERRLDASLEGPTIEVRPSARVWFGSRLSPFEVEVVGRERTMDFSCSSEQPAAQYATTSRTVIGGGGPQQLFADQFLDPIPTTIDLDCTLGWSDHIETAEEHRYIKTSVRWRGTVNVPDIPRPRTTIARMEWVPCDPREAGPSIHCVSIDLDRQHPFGYEHEREVRCATKIRLPAGAPAELHALLPSPRSSIGLQPAERRLVWRFNAPIDRAELTCFIAHMPEDLGSESQTSSLTFPPLPGAGSSPAVVEIERVDERGALHVGCGNCNHPDPPRYDVFVTVSPDPARAASHVAVLCRDEADRVMTALAPLLPGAATRVQVSGRVTTNPPLPSAALGCTAYAIPGLRASKLVETTVRFGAGSP